ncbi:MAG TPA: TetR/AcrR family transcriptional regulator [Bacteroidia bacterium]|nr:TetR/AcrR family transcriptional regulator [Bacteroidia bacterium]
MPTSTSTARREQIMQTSAQLFSERGYMATSMRDIADKMGIEAASLYNHISGKEDILQEICFGLANLFLQAVDEVNDIYFDAEQKLRMAIQNHVEILTANLTKSKVFLHEWRYLGGDKKSEFIRLRDLYEEEFTVILQNGEDENLFNVVDKKFAVLNILSSVNWITEWYRPDGRMSPQEIAQKLGDFILTGLSRPKPF